MSSLSSSSSQSFADEASDEYLDRQLERKYLKEDLAYGGLNDIEVSESNESVVDENVSKHTRKEFQATTKYINPAAAEVINQDIDETVLEVKLLLEQQLQQVDTQKQEINLTEVKKEAIQKRKLIKSEFLEKMKQPVKIEQSLINTHSEQFQQPQNIEYQENIVKQEGFPQEELLVVEDNIQEQVVTSNDIKEQYQYEAITTSTTFDNTVIQTLDKSSLDQPINLSFDNHYKQIGSVTKGKLIMFTSYFESLKDESKAIAWGRVLAFDKPQELQNGFDPNTCQTQDSSVLIQGIERVQYILPQNKIETQNFENIKDWNQVFDSNGKIVDDYFVDSIDHSTYNQEKFKGLQEIVQNYLQATLMVNQAKIEPVYRVYCFNDEKLPREPRLWLKITYSASFPQIQVQQFLSSNKQFQTVQSGSVKPLDLFLAQNQIKSASWIEFQGFDVNNYKQRIQEISEIEQTTKQPFRFKTQQKSAFITHAYHEFQLDLAIGQIKTAFLTQQSQIPLPYLSSCYLSFRYSTQNSVEEPVMATLTYSQKVSLNQNVPNQQSTSQTFIIGRRIKSAKPFSSGSIQMSATDIGFEESEKNNIVNIKLIAVEREIDLFSELFKLIGELNPDIIVCHQLYSHITNIMKRLVKSLPWHFIQNEILKFSSKIVNIQLYASQFANEKSDFNSIVRSMFQGRLIVDLEKLIQEFSPDDKQTTIDYTLNVLTNQDLIITPSFFFMDKYRDTNVFRVEFLPELMRETFAIIKICKELSILPLTSKIAQLTYFQLNNVLNLGRAKRVEFLLLQHFIKMPFIIPDYQVVDESQPNVPKYLGGSVLDPIPGLYDSVILVLDFNSLYPSIIREYDICFTTVLPNCLDDQFLDQVELLKPFKFSCQLPKIISKLVVQRQEVKKLIKDKQAKIRGSNPQEREKLTQEMQQLDIHQLALKLCANSMYGSLGYSKGRFYCPKVAAAIPFKGRQELANAVIASKSLGYDVIYGDTDSIMVDTGMKFLQLSQKVHGTTNISTAARTDIETLYKKVSTISDQISKAVSNGKKFLELGLDYVFIKQLLLAKKKYAALKITNNQSVTLEVRGLDMVRRDWCDISRDFSRKILQILMWETRSEAVEKVIHFCNILKNSFENKSTQIQFSIFKMTKSISKPLNQYGKQGEDLAHVSVAKMLQERGKIIRPGQIIEYVVLSKVVMEEKFKIKPGKFAQQCIPFEDIAKHFYNVHPLQIIDVDFYLTGQILPPLTRLCSFIPELSQYAIGSALGLELQQVATESFNNNRYVISTDIREIYANCAPFIYVCSCGNKFSWPETLDSDLYNFNLDDRSKAVRGEKNEGPLLDFDDFLLKKCSKCAQKPDFASIVISLQKQFFTFKKAFFSSIYSCSNQSCCNYIEQGVKIQIQKGKSPDFHSLIGLNLSGNCLAGGCSGEMNCVYSAVQYRNQLQFFSELFNPNSVFYKSEVVQLTQGYGVFKELFGFIQGYMDGQDVMFVNVQDKINQLNWE